MKTALITSDTYKNHNTGDGHPEKIDRVTAVIDNFKKLDNKNLIWKKPSKFEKSILIKTHSSEYIDHVDRSYPQNGFNFLDGDTVVSPGSKEATMDAVGSIITAIDGVEEKEFKNAFCAVHHGNGTQDIFFNNEKVLYISTHQFPYYPGSGSEKEIGKFNNILNIPLEAGTSAREYLNAYELVLKKLKEFKPEFLLFSAGFDAHIDDPLAQLKLNAEDYYTITKRTLEISKSFCRGNVVSILEGGYDLKALQDSTQRHVDALIEFN